jgi:hypothetical protein
MFRTTARSALVVGMLVASVLVTARTGATGAGSTGSVEADENDAEFSASVLIGAGITIGGPELHGFGGGLRTGTTLKLPIYLGVLGLLHAGSSDPGEPDVRHYSRDIGLEAGYAIRSLPIVIRPTLRGGVAWVTTERDVDGEFVSPQFGPGATVMFTFGPLHAGLDLDARVYTRPVNNGDNSYGNLMFGAYGVVGGQL